MTANDLLQLVSQALYFIVFLAVLRQAIRCPRRATIDVTLLFGATALIVAATWFVRMLGLALPPWWGLAAGGLLMALPYLLLRAINDFAGVPGWIMRAAEVGLTLSIAALVLLPTPMPAPVTVALVLSFAAVEGYAAVRVLSAARAVSGAARRRLWSVAAGSLLLGLLILLAGVAALMPSSLAPLISTASSLLGLASGTAYLLGFATPGWLRRSWHEPELRAFLARGTHLTHMPEAALVAREIERHTAAALGSGSAALGLWDEAAGVLRWEVANAPATSEPSIGLAGRSFVEQRALFTDDAPRDLPEMAERYRPRNVRAVLTAPVSTRDRQLGVLAVHASRASLFAEDDLALLQMLADQTAVILESRALIDQAARLYAAAEVTRLREDFLSSAAHDLKTPLTTIIGQAQLLQRMLTNMPELAPQVARSVARIAEESGRLRRLVLELLDAARVERGGLVGLRMSVDLVLLARGVCGRHESERHPCRVEAIGELVGAFDETRIEQLVENLVENAIKYSPDGGQVSIQLRRHNDRAQMSVVDQGIGIPTDDMPRLFERFHRGGNVDDRRFAGMGLGLYICRGIVEEHGGRIWAESTPGGGSTFHVELPIVPEQIAAA